MRFVIESESLRIPKRPSANLSYPVVVLVRDNWNDYNYLTTCNVHVFMKHESEPVSLGELRVMKMGQSKGKWTFETHKPTFRNLSDSYCSLSPSVQFYRALHELGKGFGKSVLIALRDAAFTREIWNSFEDDPCFQTSLLREGTSSIKVRDEVPTIFGKRLTFISSFVYSVQLPGAANEHRIYFDFKGRGQLPHRICLIVGTNGAGKTQLLSNLAIALSGVTAEEADAGSKEIAFGKRLAAGRLQPIPSFYRVIAVSFNAFDKFEIPEPKDNSVIDYTYCGIRNGDGTLKSEEDLIASIRSAVEKMTAARREEFRESFTNVLGAGQLQSFYELESANGYRKFSAGQRIVLNILTHLISNLDDRSLVLIDEPETHLHPSLMIALFSEILRLVGQFRSYAIIATHSPLIAQQVPSACIRVLARQDGVIEITTPDIESFGENLSQLSNVLFETREYDRDYTAVIKKLLKKHKNDPKAVEKVFKNGLGENARAFLWSTARAKKK